MHETKNIKLIYVRILTISAIVLLYILLKFFSFPKILFSFN
jgi:hypothetical protein